MPTKTRATRSRSPAPARSASGARVRVRETSSAKEGSAPTRGREDGGRRAGASRGRGRDRAIRRASLVNAAFAVVLAGCFSPIGLGSGGWRSDELFDLAGDEPQMEFFSISSWIGLTHVREFVETIFIMWVGDEAANARWAMRGEGMNFVRVGLLVLEGRSVAGTAKLKSVYRYIALGASAVIGMLYRTALSGTSPAARRLPMLRLYNSAHNVLLLSWATLVLYACTFIFHDDPVQLYYLKKGTRVEAAMQNWMLVGITTCIMSVQTALTSLSTVMQAKYCLLHVFIESVVLAHMLWQELSLGLFTAGIVEGQIFNHLFIKLTLVIPLIYGYLSDRNRCNSPLISLSGSLGSAGSRRRA